MPVSSVLSIFGDKAPGKLASRLELAKALLSDQLVVTELDRLTRPTIYRYLDKKPEPTSG